MPTKSLKKAKKTTKSKKISGTPRKTARRLENAVQSLNIAKTMNECLWVGDKNHITVYVNPMFEKLSELSLKECIGRECTSFFNKEGKRTIEENHKLRPKGISSQYEATMISKSGKKIPFLISGSPTKDGGTIGIFTNLKMLKKLEKQKRIAEQIVRNSTEAIVILDKKHRVKMWNTGAVKIFGYKEKEVLNKTITTIIPESERDTNLKLLEEVEKKKFVQNFEARRLAKNGKIIDVSLSVTKVTDERGKFIGYLVLYRDITHQKKINGELQKRFETIQDAYKELGLQKRQADYIYEIVDSAVSKDSLENLTKLIVSASCMLTKCDGAVLRLLDHNKNNLKLQSCIGVNNKWLDKSLLPLRNSLAQDALKTGRPVIIHNIDSSSRHKGINLIKAHNFKTLILLPLIIEGQPLGSLSLYATDPGKFRLIETDFLERFGRQCAMAIYVKSKAK